MKKLLLLLMMICASVGYAKEFPKGLNNTKWKQANLKSEKNYTVLEFSGRFHTCKIYRNNKLEDVSTYKMVSHQMNGDLLFVWFEDYDIPYIYEIRYDLTELGEIVLLMYALFREDKDSWIVYFIPLEE